MEHLARIVRAIPDFPKKGIVFRDITPLLQDAASYQQVIDLLSHPYLGRDIDLVLGVEARGFIIGSALAYKLGTGVVIVRKPGKLPYRTQKATYRLEYGEDSLEIHEDAIRPGQKVLIADDVLATGGTVSACLQLVKTLGGEVVGCAFLIELVELGGRARLAPYEVFSLLKF
ncbi:MAG TPA: adenine phosphoribosyltransferase [Thermodesulfobacteriota bacterium]|nr:adenine phosphoribosyltransferase [Thermodesulfobacteriota bacterium]